MRRAVTAARCLALAASAGAGAIEAGVEADGSYLLDLYHDLHRSPEMSFQEVKNHGGLRLVGPTVAEPYDGCSLGPVCLIFDGRDRVLSGFGEEREWRRA